MSIAILDKGATQSLDELHAKLAPGRRRPFMRVIGLKAEKIYRGHFSAREGDSPNKKGWPRQHFWARMRLATALNYEGVSDDTAAIVIRDRAINAKIHGGVIRPREKKFLSIPLRAEVYGTRPSANLVPGLFFLRSRLGKGGGYLVKKEGKKLVAFWRLTPRVTVSPDARALPPRDTVAEGILQTACSYVRRNTPPES